MNLSEKLDAAILTLLIIWMLLDRTNTYFRKEPK
jgi:hypothetical protein